MVVGAVAEVLEDMGPLGERRLADPVRALPAHLRVAQRRAIHPLRHVVTADPGVGAHALGHDGRRVVRTAGAEIRNAHRDILRLSQNSLRLLERGNPRGDLLVATDPLQDALADADRDLVGIERTLHREQPVALLVLLADADRLVRGAVELFAHLHLDQRALLLDHDDELEAVGELLEVSLADGPRASDLVEPNDEIVALDLVDPELVERLTHVEIALADGDDADFRPPPARGDVLVELVRAYEGEHGVAFVVVQPRLLAEDGVAQADIEPALGHGEVVGNDDVDPLQAAVDHRGRFHGLVHGFERYPGAAEARHRPAIEAVIENFLNAGGVQDRDHDVDEVIFGLMRRGRGFRGVVVTHERQHAAMLGRAGEIGVAEDVAGAVDAWPFAVPEAEHAVELALPAQLGLLRAPDRGGRDILVEAGLKADVVFVERALRADELLVEGAERRAAIAGDIARGVEAGAAVALLLHQAETHERLEAGDENPALGEVVFVVERDLVERHRTSLHGQCALATERAPGTLDSLEQI